MTAISKSLTKRLDKSKKTYEILTIIYLNNMRRSILLISLSLGIFSTTILAQDVDDTICFKIEQAKILLKDAKKGQALDSVVVILTEQIERDRARTVEMVDDLNKLSKKANRRGVIAMGLGFIAVLEGLIIAILML